MKHQTLAMATVSLFVFGAAVVAKDNPLLKKKKVVEPRWADFDATVLRKVASRMWKQNQRLLKDKKWLEDEVERLTHENVQLRKNIKLQGGELSNAYTTNARRSARIKAAVSESARKPYLGMSLGDVQSITGTTGTMIEEIDGAQRYKFIDRRKGGIWYVTFIGGKAKHVGYTGQ